MVNRRTWYGFYLDVTVNYVLCHATRGVFDMDTFFF